MGTTFCTTFCGFQILLKRYSGHDNSRLKEGIAGWIRGYCRYCLQRQRGCYHKPIVFLLEYKGNMNVLKIIWICKKIKWISPQTSHLQEQPASTMVSGWCKHHGKINYVVTRWGPRLGDSVQLVV